MECAQTKRRDDRPWCGGDVDALGLGAEIILVMLGAISAPHHGRKIFCGCVLCVVFLALAMSRN